eukprot:3310735-Prymnesium_polylepis.1
MARVRDARTTRAWSHAEFVCVTVLRGRRTRTGCGDAQTTQQYHALSCTLHSISCRRAQVRDVRPPRAHVRPPRGAPARAFCALCVSYGCVEIQRPKTKTMIIFSRTIFKDQK